MKKRVLIIDDDAGDVRIMRDAITVSHHNLDVDSADNGADGLKKIRETKPDLVLLDLNMPGLAGFDILDDLKKDPVKGAVIVVVTTSTNPTDVHGAYQRKANAYVSKPADLDAFIDSIDRILDFWFGTARLPASA